MVGRNRNERRSLIVGRKKQEKKDNNYTVSRHIRTGFLIAISTYEKS